MRSDFNDTTVNNNEVIEYFFVASVFGAALCGRSLLTTEVNVISEVGGARCDENSWLST